MGKKEKRNTEEVRTILEAFLKLRDYLIVDGHIENDRTHKMRLLFKKPVVSRDEFINGLDLISQDLNDHERILLLEIADQNQNNLIDVSEFVYLVFESQHIHTIDAELMKETEEELR